MDDTALRRSELTDNLEAFWMRFTANRQFKAHGWREIADAVHQQAA